MPGQPATGSNQENLRSRTFDYLSLVEGAIYILLGILLSATALLGIAGAAHLLWLGILDWSGTVEIFQLMDRLLFVLMLVEILHTVRISVRSHTLVVEPFLIVGLIATVRRMLVLTLQVESLTTSEKWTESGKQLFQASMIELTVLAIMVGIFVLSIRAMRKTRPPKAEATLAAFLPEGE
jgi:uncharacterized membrane protein (DUF373 family)